MDSQSILNAKNLKNPNPSTDFELCSKPSKNITCDETLAIDKNEHTDSLEPSTLLKNLQEGKFCSEYNSLASSLRVQIEQKIIDIEAGMEQYQKWPVDSMSNDLTKSDNEIEHMQIMDVRRSHSCSMSEMKESAIARLQQELDKAQLELKLKDEEVVKLTKVRDEVGLEIEDLTASLFEEANNMVRDANEKRSKAEKRAKEANMKLSILQEEVAALKSLIQRTMPYKPCCAPQNGSLMNKNLTCIQNQARETSSDNDLQNKEKILEQSRTCDFAPPVSGYKREQYEPDPVLHNEFIFWRKNPVFDKNNAFLQRIYAEDINPCMSFGNEDLSKKVMQAIENETIAIENICGKGPLPKMCALLQIPRFCKYRMNLGDNENYDISSLSRNRIAAICDLFCYLKYVENGLIKDNVHEVYLEILRKRKAITVARLGLPEANEI